MKEKNVEFGAIAVLLVALLSMVFHGFIFSILWKFFFVPLGLPELSIAHAIGIGMTIAWLTKPASFKSDKQESYPTWEDIRKSLADFKRVWIYDLTTFGILYVVQFFI
jgi:type IV secretory pathway TraG/TraD family ATPase VirD4